MGMQSLCVEIFVESRTVIAWIVIDSECNGDLYGGLPMVGCDNDVTGNFIDR